MKPAPDSEDIIWANLKIEYWSHLLRSLLVNVFMFFLVFFWAIPVAFLSSITTLENVTDKLPFLEPFLDLNSTLKGFIQGFLPSVVLLIFMAILVPVIRFTTRLQGFNTTSQVENIVFFRYWMFKLFNVLLVFTVAGVIFTIIEQVLDHPADLLTLLGTSLPKQATFFINFLLAAGLGKLPLGIVRLKDLLVWTIKLKFFAKTPRQVCLLFETLFQW